MNYWFLYTLITGKIYGTPYLGTATEWTNIPDGCGVLGPIDGYAPSAGVIDAYNHPEKYLVQNDQLILQPNFSLSFSGGTLTATLNNPPATPPTSCTFTILGKTFTETITSNTTTLTAQIHPSIGGQQIKVTASATGCIDGSANIGGQGTYPLQIYTDTQGVNHIAPINKAVLQAFYTSIVSPAYAIADLTTGLGIAFHVLFSKVLPALTSGATPVITLTTNEKNALSDMATNILGKIPVTIENSAPVPASGQPQSYDRHYQSFRDHWTDAEIAFQNYATDLANIPNLV